MATKPYFTHERLEAYQQALTFLGLAYAYAASLPRGTAFLADQLRRAATSILLNIAEGAGEASPAEKARFYRIARRSALECAAILDVGPLTGEPAPEAAREVLHAVVRTLGGLIACWEERE